MKETIVDPEGLEPLVKDKTATGLFRFSSLVFITSNSLYFLVISIVVTPMMLQSLWSAVQQDAAPARYLIEMSLVALVPVVALACVYKFNIYKNKRALLRFFVATEVPVATMLLMRSIWFSELSLVAEFLYGLVLLVSVGNGILVISGIRKGDVIIEEKSQLTLAGSALSATIAVGGIYIGLIAITFLAPLTVGILIAGLAMVFFALPAMVEFPSAIFAIPFGAVVAVIGAGCFVLAFYSPWCYFEQWLSRMKVANKASHGITSLIVLTVLIAGFILMSQQSQRPVLELLNSHPVTEADQRALVEKQNEINDGLVNAYLGSLRYIPEHIGWSDFFQVPVFEVSDWVLRGLLAPMMYHGNPDEDRRLAETEYEQFFDAPIERAERRSVLETLHHHWTPTNDNGAGLLDIDQRRIHVESQDISTIVEEGVATITIQEALVNKTSRRLESLLYFTLPVDAVVTGLWLSDTEEDLERYAFQVAPRGAAQQVYQEQVAIRVDPALLEKVGPQQYRLRVFPVLPTGTMHVKLEYKAVPDDSNRWPLPVLLEQRNVYWSKNTKRTINGETVAEKSIFSNNKNEWILSDLATTDVPKSSELSYRDGEKLISAVPLSDFPLSIEGQRLALLIDGSYSMQGLQKHLIESIQAMNNAELYFCKTQCVKTDLDQQSDWVFFGNTQPLEQLATFNADINSQDYDAVFLLSDGGTYEFGDQEFAVDHKVPTWLVQRGKGAYAYQDNLLDTLRGTGGGVVQSVSQALIELSVSNSKSNLAVPLGINGDRLWLQGPASGSGAHNPQLAEIVAGLKIEGLSRGQQDVQPSQLDGLHDMAVERGVVSRFSSMIVLVNEQQKNRLAQLSGQDDRFEREVETGKQLGQTVQGVPAVPEPHEWALLLLGLLMLTMVTCKRAREEQWTLAMVLERMPFLNLGKMGDMT